jgi:ketosteroid isomerase-like protein
MMNTPNATVDVRDVIARTTAELLAAVNASNADRCLAVWADDGVLMPPHHPSVLGREALVRYFRDLFSRSKFKFAFTSSNIHLAGDIAFERVTYTAMIWPGEGAQPIEDAGKGLHVYGRQPDGSWKLTYDIWNSDHDLPLDRGLH